MPTVPDAAGLHLAAAFDLLRQADLRPVLLGLPTVKTTGNTGYVIAAQEPAAGDEVEPGARIYLAAAPHPLSFGGGIDGSRVAEPGTPAPDLIGMEIEQALARVTEEGFVGVVFQPNHGVERLAVSRQEPEPGQPVECFREVVLRLD